MSMFLSKLLSGRNNTKTKLELLTEAWTNIQKYYETAADALKDAVDLTPIPSCLQNIVKLIQAEELEHERAGDSLETGPCLEYILQKRVLEELVEFAKVDTPYGMRIHCLRFFCSLVTNVHAQLLPERAVHVPLQKLITSCHRLIAHHYEQLASDAEACSEERIAAISELSLELVKLMHGVFSHFKGTNAALMDLFFERGWCRGLGDNVWRSGKDGKTVHKRPESVDEKMAWNMFLTPRFDMFTYLIDYMNIPGETGEIAREGILFALRLLDGDPEYVCYVVEYSGLCEVMAERLALFFALLPKNTDSFSIAINNRVAPVRSPRRRIQFSVPVMITNNSLMITVNTQNSFKKKRRKRSPFDVNFVRLLQATHASDRVDRFYSFWEYLNDVARVADRRLMISLMAQLTTIFWHPVVCMSLSSPLGDAAAAATAYTTEMIRSLTDQKLLHAFLVALIGEEGGSGKDFEPEIRRSHTRHDFIEDDNDNEDGGSEPTEDSKAEEEEKHDEYEDELTLRTLLINRIDSDHQELSLSTLRFFDTVLETYNQFAIFNLVLRNYLDDTDSKTSPESIADKQEEEKTNESSENEGALDDEERSREGENNERTTNKQDEAEQKEKVRWLVERILSLLPLEDELERMKTPPLSSIIPLASVRGGGHGQPSDNPSWGDAGDTSSGSDDSSGSTVSFSNVVLPGNSYDDYFHEARERFQYGMLARNFWQAPYPPPKTKKDLEWEAEGRRGRSIRPVLDSSRVAPDASSSTSTRDSAMGSVGESYEGLFLTRIFDQFFRMLESTMEQNLLVTSILQKIAGVVDRRVDGVICDWRAVRVGCDGALYGGVWTLPSAKDNRRSLYALLEQVTFEALKRAQLVPNFETRISLAKKRGILSGQQQPLSAHAQHAPSHHLLRSVSANNLKTSVSTPRESSQVATRHPSLSHVFNMTTSTTTTPLNKATTTTPSSAGLAAPKDSSKSATILPGRRHSVKTPILIDTTNLPISNVDALASPSSAFFQQTQRANATPVTMTNPFAKLTNFVNSYIVLQEFCKELAAVILVRHATNYNDIGLERAESTADPMDVDAGDWGDEGEDPKRYQDKWKNRISVVSTLADWRSVRSLDTIDEAITARVPSVTTGGL